jgi:hypothetical protein
MTENKPGKEAKPAERRGERRAQHFFAEKQNLDPERAEMRLRESDAEAQVEKAAEISEKPEKKDRGARPDQAQGVERDPKLNDPDATPGTGMLPPIGEDDSNMQPSS